MDLVLQLLPVFIMMAEGLFLGKKTGPAKKAWVVQQIENVVKGLIATQAQKDATWATVMAMLTLEFPEVLDAPAEPKPQSFLGKLIDLFAGLFA